MQTDYDKPRWFKVLGSGGDSIRMSNWLQLRTLNCPMFVPWQIMLDHEAQALKNHYQNIEKLDSRGGLAPDEMVAVLEDRPWHPMELKAAIERLHELLRADIAAREAADEAKRLAFAENVSYE